MAVVDSRTAPLQFNFLNHGTVHLLSNKLYNKLKSSDEGLFHGVEAEERRERLHMRRHGATVQIRRRSTKVY